jgi:hypothetical protein
MSKVYAPQQPSRFDTTLKMWVPTMNMTPAEKFGPLVVLLPPNANRLHTAPLLAALKDGMEGFTSEDYLVCVGDPSLIAAAACIASRKTGGLLRLLKWDRMSGDYIATELKI